MRTVTRVTFTVPELWLLHDVIRHETAQQDHWKFPPADLDLNEQIAFSLEACDHLGLPDYDLELSIGQLLAIDHQVRGAMKSADGQAQGVNILLKVFRARKALTFDNIPIKEVTADDRACAQSREDANRDPDDLPADSPRP